MDQLTNERLQAIYQAAVARGAATRGAHVPPQRLHDLAARRGLEAQRLTDLDHVMSCEACRSGYELLCSVEAAREPDATRTRWVVAVAALLVLAVGLTTLRPRPAPDASIMRDGAAVPRPVAPAGAVEPTAARTFTWHAVPAATRYDFALLDAAGTPLHTAATADTTYTLPMNVVLAAGNYQWVTSAALPQGQSAVAQAQAFQVR